MNIKGSFYNEVILEVVKPVIADVSAVDYEAESFQLNGTIAPVQHPFIVCHPAAVTLKVLPWYTNTAIVWQFPAGPFPMPLKKILNDAGNTATLIQIGY